MRQIEYTKKPSGPTLRAAIRKALAAGETWVQLTWPGNSKCSDPAALVTEPGRAPGFFIC